MNSEPTAIFNAACAAIAAGCAVFVAFRDGRWRKNGLAAQLDKRITAAQEAADRWHETEPAKALKAEVDRQGALLVTHAGALEHVATKRDIERVEGATRRVEQMVKSAADGVDRIEGILIKRALNGDRP